jgi:hypothetical protein
MTSRILKLLAALALLAGWWLPPDVAVGQQPQQVIPGIPVPSTNAFTTGFIFSGALGGGNAGYPAGAIPRAAASTGANGTGPAFGTLSAVPGAITYICGFRVEGLGATTPGPVTVTVGPLTASGITHSFEYTYAGATVANTPLIHSYTPCMPGASAGSAINVTVPGSAGNTSTLIDVSGYSQ